VPVVRSPFLPPRWFSGGVSLEGGAVLATLRLGFGALGLLALRRPGPLAVALAGARHWTAVGWAILAAGVAAAAAAVGIAPFGIAMDHAGMFTGRSVLLGVAVALRRMPRSLFSILTSTEPAAGAILGLLALGQRIALLQWAGIAAVVIASVGATRAHKAREARRAP